ncbi:MAG TPA: response regulator [Ignavibacteriaceae bacterium]|jgi:PAS domain S-box-containing protein|nr:MAG: Alkaline phosphatase synthesis sensor protein PhoR [Ignavibacteria bacterium ADurb.Bin266]OQY74767.1 MAG: hybrid sensor histidine kinase/response regulator [Ignavibacteriales bacterium UTCHB2]HQF42105.1 response regulator [Ignavibacteriaceae bacterium]HQI40485.1 response regulator [Ignavibacteriaceae bacterium]
MNNYKPKVLIVDDEKGLRIGAQRLLEMEGYEVTTAENGTEGIKFGTENEFDIAVIDLKMPDIDGLEVLKKIRKKFPYTVCFIATAYASYETAVEATRLGAHSYIPKPFSPEELIANIKEGYQRRLVNLEADKWRREREERLLEVAFEKTRLNTIINSITDGVLVINKEGLAVLYNPAALRFLELSGIAVEEYILDKLRPEILELYNKLLNDTSNENKSYTIQIELKPNREFFIEVTASAVRHPGDNVAGVVIVFKDITELKKIEFVKSQFVSMVSHELKAPIAAVYGFLKLFNDDSITLTSEQKKEYEIRSMVRLDGLLKMVNDLLDISRMELKTVHREIKKVCLHEVISSILELFQLDINKKGIQVIFEKDASELCIKADNDEISRLFTNLISNAIKYNRDQGIINISLYQSDNYIITEIKDSGIGLKPEDKQRLFGEFFRAKNEKTKNISGTGLGLSIVKRIVDSYSGKIEVESEFGEGTTFKVFFPAMN